jgi:hypothetical protein
MKAGGIYSKNSLVSDGSIFSSETSMSLNLTYPDLLESAIEKILTGNIPFYLSSQSR